MKGWILAVVAALLACGPLGAQTQPWDELLSNFRTQGARTRERVWILALSPSVPEPTKDDRLMPLLVSDLRTLPVPQITWDQLRKDREWAPDAAWALVDPAGVIALHGIAPVDPGKVIEGMELKGVKPSFLLRKAFLKVHPEHGEAWGAELGFALSLARLRFRAWTEQSPTDRALRSDPKRIEQLWSALEPARAQALFAEGLEAVQHLAQVPGWGANWVWLTFPRSEFLAGVPELRRTVLPLEAKLRQEMEAVDPFVLDSSGFPLSPLWLGSAKLAGLNPPERLEAIREPEGGIQRLEAFFMVRLSDPSPDPEKLIPILDRLLESQARGSLDAAPEWTSRAQAQGRLLKAELLLRAGRPEAAASELELVHKSAGKAWEWQASMAKSLLDLARMKFPESITRILEAHPLPDPLPSPPPPPLTLSVLDPKSFQPWQTHLGTEPFSPWNPKELILAMPAPAEAERWRRRFPKDRLGWVLVLGDQVLAKGEALPDARALAGIMESAAPSALQRISAYLARNSDHLGARKARRRILLARMPNRWLEPGLAEDCLATLLPPTPKPDGWKPDPAIWSWTARKALPQVERKLESWPRQTDFWSAWLGWSELDPSAPSPLRLAERVQVWPPDRGLQGDLPPAVQKAVAEELRRQGRFEDQRAWFRAAWEAQDHRAWSEVVAIFPDQESRSYFHKQRQEVREAVVRPYREALTVLRRDAELLALDREVASWLGESPKEAAK